MLKYLHKGHSIKIRRVYIVYCHYLIKITEYVLVRIKKNQNKTNKSDVY